MYGIQKNLQAIFIHMTIEALRALRAVIIVSVRVVWVDYCIAKTVIKAN
jgi:hypothetical protein